ncbi:MAG: DUF72 domain-containing protein [Planctomycetota bacterium]
MKLYVGTSGYAYKEWVGPFYPEDVSKNDWLSYYAGRLSGVEINNSFYRVPRTEVVEKWAASVPADFRFVLKVTRRVTHFSRLKETADEPMQWMCKAAEALGERRGPLLFQLPPNLRADVDRLRDFLGRLPAGMRPAFEFRHASWLSPEVAEVLGAAGATLCLAETDDEPAPELTTSADFGYLRLRKQGYEDDEIAAWVDRARAMDWREVYVFFKHEDAGVGPALAARFRERFEAAG